MQTAALGNFPINAAAPFGPAQPCMPQYPPYLSDLRWAQRHYPKVQLLVLSALQICYLLICAVALYEYH